MAARTVLPVDSMVTVSGISFLLRTTVTPKVFLDFKPRRTRVISVLLVTLESSTLVITSPALIPAFSAAEPFFTELERHVGNRAVAHENEDHRPHEFTEKVGCHWLLVCNWCGKKQLAEVPAPQLQPVERPGDGLLPKRVQFLAPGGFHLRVPGMVHAPAGAEIVDILKESDGESGGVGDRKSVV